LFATQLRALLGAAEDCGNIRVLFPMVLGAGDFAEAKALVQDIRGELGTARSPLVGAMIETPASLFALDEIFQIADFACIGTNDLTQFMLAADRGASELAGDFSVLHPGVLRAIAKVIEAGRRAQREVCVCGEAASYPLTACLLAGLGVRQLSMSPLRAARVRYMLRQTRAEALKKLGNEALHARTADEVRRLLRDARLEANG
jgi:phosphoenolpyruvate-protein kinase (PTS system EI component)